LGKVDKAGNGHGNGKSIVIDVILPLEDDMIGPLPTGQHHCGLYINYYSDAQYQQYLNIFFPQSPIFLELMWFEEIKK